MVKTAALLIFTVIATLIPPVEGQQCQPPREMKAAAENLNFAGGPPGTAPPGWTFSGTVMPPNAPIYEALTVAGAACHGNPQCAVVHSIRAVSPGQIVFLYQVIDATRYRGKRLTFRADVRVDTASRSVARLLVRVHRNDCSTSFRDDMGDHPVTTGRWAPYEIQAPIAQDARDIEFGMQLIGPGSAWIDDVSMVFSGTAEVK